MNQDYEPETSGELRFAAGETTQTFSVQTHPDTEVEGNEDFSIWFTASSEVIVPTTAIIGTIRDNDSAQRPLISLSGSAGVTEGEPLVYTLGLSSVAATTLTVALQLDGIDNRIPTGGADAMDGTSNHLLQPVPAQAGRYEFQFELPAGSSSATLSIATIDDIANELDSLVTLRVLPGTAYQLDPNARAEVITSIFDNDDDTTAAITTLNMPASATAAMIPGLAGTTRGVATEGEGILFMLALSESQDRVQPISLVLEQYGDYLGATGESTSGGVRAVVTLTPIDPAGSSADYRYTVQVPIEPGQVRATLSLTTVDDDVSEATGRVQATVSPADFYEVRTPGRAEVQLRDNEPLRLTVANARAAEAAGRISFVFSLPYPAAHAVTANYQTEDGTAQAGSDYRGDSGLVILSPGATSATIGFNLIPDTNQEPEEYFLLKLSNVNGAGLATTQATGTITADPTPDSELSVGNGLGWESDVASNGERAVLQFRVQLQPAATTRVVVSYRTSNGAYPGDPEATSDSDYTPVVSDGRLTFNPGEVSKVVSISVVDDALPEHEEFMRLQLFDPVGPAVLHRSASQGLGTIVSDDPPQLQVADASAVEGDFVTFVASFNLTREVTTQVLVSTADGGGPGSTNNPATAPQDYELVTNRVLLFNAGQTTLTFSILTQDDDKAEGDEDFRLVFSSVHVSVPASPVVGTIIDNEAFRPSVTVATDKTAITEGESFVITFTASARFRVIAFLDIFYQATGTDGFEIPTAHVTEQPDGSMRDAESIHRREQHRHAANRELHGDHRR